MKKFLLLVLLLALIGGGGAYYYIAILDGDLEDLVDLVGLGGSYADEEIIVESIPVTVPEDMVKYAVKVEPLDVFGDDEEVDLEVPGEDGLDVLDAEVVEEALDVEPEPEVVETPKPKPAPKPKTVETLKPKPAPKPKAVEKPKPKPEVAGATKPWAIGVASFSSKKKAETLKAALISGGYNAYMTTATVKGALWYRVRVGFYETREKAKVDSKLISRNFKDSGTPWIMKPSSKERKKYYR